MSSVSELSMSSVSELSNNVVRLGIVEQYKKLKRVCVRVRVCVFAFLSCVYLTLFLLMLL